MTARLLAARQVAEHPGLTSETAFACGRLPSPPPEMTTKPDAKKLARIPTDALFGVLLVDDAWVGMFTTRKQHGEPEPLEVAVR